MSCTVALSSSPVFSPSRSRVSSPLFCKTSTASPEKSISPASSSPLRIIRLQKPPTALIKASSATVSPPKRKRPARLDIPVGVGGGDGLFTPVVGGNRRDVVEVEEEGYSVYCKRGRREAMEDRFSAEINLRGDPKQAFFGVFDGHGGAKAAEFAAKNLHMNTLDEVERRENDEVEIVEAVKSAYLKTDSDFLKEDIHGGTCSVTALLRDGHLIVSNAGDCRAVVSRGGVAEALTSDHRPSRKDEKERIENLGGYVDYCRGVWRIQGSLAVSRGIGDGHLKQWVIANPETQMLKIESDFEFLMLASDGLWDKVSNQEAVDIARPLCSGVQKPDMLSACKKLAALSVSRGSCDDVTVMLIQLGQFF